MVRMSKTKRCETFGRARDSEGWEDGREFRARELSKYILDCLEEGLKFTAGELADLIRDKNVFLSSPQKTMMRSRSLSVAALKERTDDALTWLAGHGYVRRISTRANGNGPYYWTLSTLRSKYGH